jgi:hypothetical protein
MALALSDVQSWRPETVQAAALEFKAKLGKLGNTLDAAKTATNKGAAFSEGQGEEARFDFVDQATSHGWRKHELMEQLHQVADEAGYDLIAKRGHVATAVENAARAGLKVWNDGSVTGYDENAARKHAQAIGQTLADLEQSDKDYGQKIDNLAQLIDDRSEKRDYLGFGGPGHDMPLHPKQSPLVFKENEAFKEGDPKAGDVKQKSVGDCYLDATLMAMAGANPKRIRDMIHFDPATGDFVVSLPGKPPIHVSQQDIEDDIKAGGASLADEFNTNEKPLWPAILECAYAKDQAPSPTRHDGSSLMQDQIAAIGHGGVVANAMSVLLGNQGTPVLADTPLREYPAYTEIKAALDAHRPAVLSVNSETDLNWLEKALGASAPSRDGLENLHAFQVVSVQENDHHEPTITLRNPWGQNHTYNPSEPSPPGSNPDSPFITVKLKDIIQSGGYMRVDIGDH